jgi:Peptidase family M28
MRTTSWRRIPLALLSGISPLIAIGCAPATSGNRPMPGGGPPANTQPAITAADLRTRVFIYADDSMQGRSAGTLGNLRAIRYIAAEAQRLGLTPGGDDATYFQTVPLVTRGLTSSTALAVNGRPLVLWRDFAPLPYFPAFLPYGPRLEATSTPTIYAGRYASGAKLSSDSTKGKVVVYGAPLDSTGHPDWRFLLYGPTPVPPGAVGVAFATLELTPPAQLADVRHTPLALPEPRISAPTERPLGLWITGATAEQIFGAQLDSLPPGTIGGSLTGRVGFLETPSEAPVQNVIAILPGSDPRLKAEYVALGAHNDHIGMVSPPLEHDSVRVFNRLFRRTGEETPPPKLDPEQVAAFRVALDSARQAEPSRPDSIANGADDDGSGSMALLEIAEALASAKPPRRSVIFVWHAAEELGLFGSQWFTEHPTVPLDSIVAEINVDMVGRGEAADAPEGGPGYLLTIGSRRLSSELGDVAERVARERKHGFALNYKYDAPGHPAQVFCRSDHYMYARFGIPVAFFTTDVHPDYHQVTDEPQYLAYPKYARVTAYLSDLAAHLANLEHRPVVDQPKPDPRAPCRQ